MQTTTKWKWGHIWDILATVPHSFGLGISAPPCFRALFGKVQQCCTSHDQTTWGFKILSVPPPPSPPFLSAVHAFLTAFMASSGGTCPSAPPPPPLGSGTVHRPCSHLQLLKLGNTLKSYISQDV